MPNAQRQVRRGRRRRDRTAPNALTRNKASDWDELPPRWTPQAGSGSLPDPVPSLEPPAACAPVVLLAFVLLVLPPVLVATLEVVAAPIPPVALELVAPTAPLPPADAELAGELPPALGLVVFVLGCPPLEVFP